jgi:hypothetical protein
MSRRFILSVEEDEHGDCFITLPDELLDELGWQIDDVLEYTVEGENVYLSKVDE